MGSIRTLLRFVLSVNIVFVLLLAFSYPFLDEGSGTYVIAVLSLIPVALSLVGSAVLIAKGWNPI